MNQSDRILLGREERALLISKYLKDYQTVVSLKANMPGNDKNSYLSYLLINAFSFFITDTNPDSYVFKTNEDGPFVLMFYKDNLSLELKRKAIEAEEKSELGRLIDIDVYGIDGNISRTVKRKCFLCDDLALNCIKISKHSLKDTQEYIETKIKEYYYKLLDNLIEESILSELNLEPKFGLVTPNSNGSHNDMDYHLMLKAKDAIKSNLIDMFFLSSEKKFDSNLVQSLKNIGISAETDMFKATNGVNCYKGLIFNLGLVISSYAIKISRIKEESIFSIAKILANSLFENYTFNSMSYGDIAYKKYAISGVRGEALSGFENVQKGLKHLYLIDAKYLLNLLVYYIINIDDTTFLKRAKNIKFYNEVKSKFMNLDLNSCEQVEKLNDFCISKNLSFGGSADLLVVSVFIKKIANLGINIFNENNIPKF